MIRSTLTGYVVAEQPGDGDPKESHHPVQTLSGSRLLDQPPSQYFVIPQDRTGGQRTTPRRNTAPLKNSSKTG
jgi:hypothetical protein